MKSKYFKFIALTGIIFMTITACKSQLGTLSEVNKSVVYPGVEQGNIYIVYTGNFIVIKPLFVTKIELLLPEKNIEIKDYKIVDKKAGIILPRKKMIPAGDYQFKANLIYSKELTKEGDKLQIHLQSETGKTYVITTSIAQGETIMRM